ncbi:MAG: Rap1a/Tai family immunity protein [Roseiarcus sp.]
MIAIVTPNPAFSYDGFQTGNTLLANCISPNLDICLGYLEGISDAMALGSLIYKSHACLPSGVSGRQLIDITVEFLQSHASIRHFQAASLVAVAFANSFPCPGK